LGNRELALLAVLLLRGPQTLGELRARTQSLHDFEDMDTVEAVLKRMSERENPLTKPVSNKWAHLMCGDVAALNEPIAPARMPSPDRMAQLESTVADLTARLAALEAQMADFKKQFE
jgi:uncharacterized protein YceH (UPF0502 family)